MGQLVNEPILLILGRKTRLSAKKGVFFYIYKNIEKNRLEITSTVHRSIITCLKITKH